MPSPDTVDTLAARAAPRPRLRIAQKALRWHRAVGVCAALFLIFLSVTGLLLMSSDRLGLPHVQIASRWLLDWYGIRPPPPPVGMAVAGHWVTQFGSRVYLDTREVDGVTGVLLGVVASSEDELQIVTDRAVTLVGRDGAVLERLGEEAGLPTGLTAAATDGTGRLLLKTSGGLVAYDDDSGEFAAVAANSSPQWASLQSPPDAIVSALTQGWRGEGLPLERVVLDLHSGRLFGRAGVWVINLASVALLVLACTGVIAWWQRRPRARA